jgi:hypothetical protein
MKKIKFFFLFFLLLSFYTSCLLPPNKYPEINFTDLLSDNISILNKAKNDKENYKKYFTEIMIKFRSVIVFKKDSSITIDTLDAEPGENDIVYSKTGNRFFVNKPFYYTHVMSEPVYSFDAKTWYSVRSDIKKSIEGLHGEYEITPEIINNNAVIRYKLALSRGKNPLIVKVNKNKQIITLKKGMVFFNATKSKDKEDLNSKILYVPAGVVLNGYYLLRGDFVESSYINGKINIKAVRDFYLYFITPSSFMISLDKKEWAYNLVSEDTKHNIELYAKSDNEIFFNMMVSLNFDSKKIGNTSSIFKLIFMNKD